MLTASDFFTYHVLTVRLMDDAFAVLFHTGMQNTNGYMHSGYCFGQVSINAEFCRAVMMFLITAVECIPVLDRWCGLRKQV